MKKIAIFAMAAMVSLASCDILDNKPYDKFTIDNYFTSEANLDLFVNYFYSEFAGYATSGDFYFNKLNDDQAVTGLAPWTYTQVPATADAWKKPYNQLRRCNLLIEKAPTVPGLSQTKIDNYVAIGRLFRAWQHYKLVRNYGDVVLIDHVVDPTEGDIVYGKRNDRDSVMNFVLEDLNYACENISQKSTSRVEINKYVAAAMKAEICLYEGSFSKYRVAADGQKAPDAARAEKFFRACADACEMIINSGNYSLTPNYADVYKSLNLEGNKEMILYKHYAYPQMGHSVIDYTCGSTQVDGINKACFNSYLDKEGELIEYGDDHGELVGGKLSIAKQVARRDPRMAVHIDGLLQFKGNAVVRFEGKENQKNAAASTSSTGYGVAKFDTDQLDKEHRQEIGKGDTDAPIFWYAVILLNYAEAKAELGEFDAVKAKTLDAVRNRAGFDFGFELPEVEDTNNNMGVSNLLWEIRRERRIELMFDKNDRYWSLVRWHQLDKLDTQKYPDQTRGAWIKGLLPEDSAFDGTAYPVVDEAGYIDVRNGGAERIFDNKYYLLPIPSGQLLLNPELTQNPGW